MVFIIGIIVYLSSAVMRGCLNFGNHHTSRASGQGKRGARSKRKRGDLAARTSLRSRSAIEHSLTLIRNIPDKETLCM